MSDSNKDKRRVSKFLDQMKILIDALGNPEKSRSKSLRKLFKSVTRNSNPADAEAIQLTLGRDHEWRQHQVAVMKALSKIIRLMMMTDGTTFHEMEWSVLLELMINCGVFDVVHLLITIKVPQSVTQDDASRRFGDSWESVYFHSLELTSNVLGSDYIRHTEEKTKPFLDLVVANKTFLDVVVRHAMESSRPLQTCHALHIISLCCSKHLPAARKIARKKDLFPQLCYYVNKNNAVKIVLEWLKGGVEQFEFDMMADRPEGMIPVYHNECFTKNSIDEMTKDELRHYALTYAYTMQLFSLKLMAVMCVADGISRDLVSKDPELLQPCIRWMSAPVNTKFAGAAVKETLLIVTGLCGSEAICHKLVSSYNLIELVEKGVYYSSLDHVSAYFHVATKIASHAGMLRSKIGAVESIARSAAIHMYCHNHELQLYVLAYLTYIVETEGVHHMIKYFGPHHIHYYPEYYFNKARALDMDVTDLLKGYQHYARTAYENAAIEFRRLKGSRVLNQDEAERLKIRGNEAFRMGHFEKAINHYTSALVICPPLKKNELLLAWYDLPITLYCNRAQVYLLVGKNEQAVKDCDKAAARCIGVGSANNKVGNHRTNTLLRKALFRRAKGLFALGDYHRAICDVTLCLEGERSHELFQALHDKIMIHYRQKHETEPVPACDECGLGVGKKMKRCANCTALYCSRDCQLKAWDKFHKTNCKEFVDQVDGDDY